MPLKPNLRTPGLPGPRSSCDLFMATKPNKAKRALITAIVLVAAATVVTMIAIGQISGSRSTPAASPPVTTPQVASDAVDQVVPAGDAEPAPAGSAAEGSPIPAMSAPAATAEAAPRDSSSAIPAGLRPRAFDRAGDFTKLGDTDPDGPWRFQVAFSPYGA